MRNFTVYPRNYIKAGQGDVHSSITSIVAKDLNEAKILSIAEFKKLVLPNKIKPFGDNGYCFGEGSTVDKFGGKVVRATGTAHVWYSTKVYGEASDVDQPNIDEQKTNLTKVLISAGWKIDNLTTNIYHTRTFGQSATAGTVRIEAQKHITIDATSSGIDFDAIVLKAYDSASENQKKWFNEWETFVRCVGNIGDYKPSLTNIWITAWVKVLTDNFQVPTVQFKTTSTASAERISTILNRHYYDVKVHHNTWYRGYLDSIIIATNEGKIELDVDPNYAKDTRTGHGTLNVAHLKIGGIDKGRIN